MKVRKLVAQATITPINAAMTKVKTVEKAINIAMNTLMPMETNIIGASSKKLIMLPPSP